jgi:hypothetical protein
VAFKGKEKGEIKDERRVKDKQEKGIKSADINRGNRTDSVRKEKAP